jgi:hypothetical protein
LSNLCEIFPFKIGIIEMEEGKLVEVDELGLGICLIHVFYVVLPCRFTNMLGVYIIELKGSIMNKMTIMNVEQVVAYSGLFTYYEQNMVNNLKTSWGHKSMVHST